MEEIGRQTHADFLDTVKRVDAEGRELDRLSKIRHRKSHLVREGTRSYECGGPGTVMPCGDCSPAESPFSLHRAQHAVEVPPRARRTPFQASFDCIALIVLGFVLGSLTMWFLL